LQALIPDPYKTNDVRLPIPKYSSYEYLCTTYPILGVAAHRRIPLRITCIRGDIIGHSLAYNIARAISISSPTQAKTINKVELESRNNQSNTNIQSNETCELTEIPPRAGTSSPMPSMSMREVC
jgi:hypothetical protein